MNEMELVGRFGEVDPLPPEALERAEAVLRATMVAAHEPELSRVDNRPRQRRSRRRIVTAVAAVAMVAAGTCGVLLVSGSGAPRTKHVAASTHAARGTSRPTTPIVPTTARLVAKVTAALDDVSGDIFHVNTVSENGWSDDTWLSADGVTRTTSYDHGVENSDLTYTVSAGNLSATVVDYADSAWWSYTEPVSPPPSDCNLPTCRDLANGGVPPGPDIDGVPGSTAGVKWLLTSGGFTVVSGNQVVDGVDTYEITESLGEDGATRSIWIDAATDLPVLLKSSGSANPGNNYVSEVSWLPPTSANLATLQVPIPTDFTHSPSPISPPAPAGGGVG